MFLDKLIIEPVAKHIVTNLDAHKKSARGLTTLIFALAGFTVLFAGYFMK